MTTSEELLAKTGYDAIGFRPVGTNVAVLLTEEDRILFGSLPSSAKTPAPSPILKPEKKGLVDADGKKAKLFLGDKLEKEMAQKEQLLKVVAISKLLAKAEDAVSVGDLVGLANKASMNEIKVGDNYYGIIPSHAIIAIFKPNVEVTA